MVCIKKKKCCTSFVWLRSSTEALLLSRCWVRLIMLLYLSISCFSHTSMCYLIPEIFSCGEQSYPNQKTCSENRPHWAKRPGNYWWLSCCTPRNCFTVASTTALMFHSKPQGKCTICHLPRCARGTAMLLRAESLYCTLTCLPCSHHFHSVWEWRRFICYQIIRILINLLLQYRVATGELPLHPSSSSQCSHPFL